MNIYQRLAAAMADVSYIQKEKKQGMRYTIVSHDAVTAKVRPVLLKHGIVYHPIDIEATQVGNRTQVRLAVRFVNIEDPSDTFVVPSLGYGIDDQDKGPGKAISYAVKYALLKAMGLETGDDPEDDQDTPHDPNAGPYDPPGEPAPVGEVHPQTRYAPHVREGLSQVPSKAKPAGWHDAVTIINGAKDFAELQIAIKRPHYVNTTSAWSNYWLRKLADDVYLPKVAEFRGAEEAAAMQQAIHKKYPLDRAPSTPEDIGFVSYADTAA